MSMRVKTTKIGRQKHSEVRRAKSNGAEWQGVFVDFSKLLIVIMVAASLIGTYAHISSSIQKTASENIKLEQEIKSLTKEIENHQAKIESLKSLSHINKQITKFGMDLHLPNSRQRYEITLQMPRNFKGNKIEDGSKQITQNSKSDIDNGNRKLAAR